MAIVQWNEWAFFYFQDKKGACTRTRRRRVDAAARPRLRHVCAANRVVAVLVPIRNFQRRSRCACIPEVVMRVNDRQVGLQRLLLRPRQPVEVVYIAREWRVAGPTDFRQAGWFRLVLLGGSFQRGHRTHRSGSHSNGAAPATAAIHDRPVLVCWVERTNAMMMTAMRYIFF